MAPLKNQQIPLTALCVHPNNVRSGCDYDEDGIKLLATAPPHHRQTFNASSSRFCPIKPWPRLACQRRTSPVPLD